MVTVWRSNRTATVAPAKGELALLTSVMLERLSFAGLTGGLLLLIRERFLSHHAILGVDAVSRLSGTDDRGEARVDPVRDGWELRLRRGHRGSVGLGAKDQ